MLRFFVAPTGELRCRAIDVYTRRTWMVSSARDVHRLLREEPTEPGEQPVREQLDV